MPSGCGFYWSRTTPDHAFVALTVARQVLGECIELIHAQNANEAVDLIGHFTAEDRPDLFMVDLRLPDNGGFSVISAVQRQHRVRERAAVRHHHLRV